MWCPGTRAAAFDAGLSNVQHECNRLLKVVTRSTNKIKILFSLIRVPYLTQRPLRPSFLKRLLRSSTDFSIAGRGQMHIWNWVIHLEEYYPAEQGGKQWLIALDYQITTYQLILALWGAADVCVRTRRLAPALSPRVFHCVDPKNRGSGQWVFPRQPWVVSAKSG